MTNQNRPGGRGRNFASSGAAESFFGRLSNQLDDWLVFEVDGSVTAKSGKVELGTGIRTALAQIVAEELDVPFDRVRMILGDTELSPDEGYTAGSMTIQTSGAALRQAAAEARQALLEMAADRLDATPDELIVVDGVISVKRDPQRSATYAELMGGKSFNREVTGRAPLKSPASYRIVGLSTPRVDLPGKFTGQSSFVHDVRVPGMLHARLVRPPGMGADLIAIDEDSVKDAPGLVKVVRQGNFVAVVAEREEQAIQAAKQLKVEWGETAALPRMEELYTTLRAQPTHEEALAQNGDVERALTQAARRVRAAYFQPYHAHATIGPSCAVADVQPDRATLWSNTQGPYPLRGAVAQLIGLPPEKVRLIHMEGAGGYGHSGADDVVADAAVLSQAVGRPVRVQWSREDEFIWEPKSPAMIMEVQGGLDAQGQVVAWDYHVWSPTHMIRARAGEQLLTGQLMSGKTSPPASYFGGGGRNAPTNYTFPDQRVAVHWLAGSPLRISALRSLGGAANTFANESFMDELAAAANLDPVEFRLRHLTDPRAREALTAAAEKANWDTRPSPRPTQAGLAEGRGVAFAQYENDQAIVASIAFVQVDTASGSVRVKRMVIAHDCGLIINPDGLKNQIEGNAIQSLSRALKEEVKFDQSRITSVNWETYPILTFSEVPDIDIFLINRPDETAVGAGEPSTVTTAAAVANAIFDATGARVRQVPFTPERVKAALALR